MLCPWALQNCLGATSIHFKISAPLAREYLGLSAKWARGHALARRGNPKTTASEWETIRIANEVAVANISARTLASLLAL
jgi:hypothetical protein